MPQRVPASDVFSVLFHPWNTISITSDAGMLTKSLGNRTASAPAPAGWEAAPVTEAAGWSPVIATVNALEQLGYRESELHLLAERLAGIHEAAGSSQR